MLKTGGFMKNIHITLLATSFLFSLNTYAQSTVTSFPLTTATKSVVEPVGTGTL